MLTSLGIRNVVLIDRIDLAFDHGLSVLTGETGAGKSILLDALGLATGTRAEGGLVRHGAERASVTASFEVPASHASNAMLDEYGIDSEEILVLRRVVEPEPLRQHDGLRRLRLVPHLALDQHPRPVAPLPDRHGRGARSASKPLREGGG